MSISKTAICNLALAGLGLRAIATLDERTPEALYAAQHYDLALQEVLRDHPWNFAQRRERLAQVDVPDAWQTEYPLAYAYPADALRVHALLRGEDAVCRGSGVSCGAYYPRGVYLPPTQDFTVGHDNGRTLILTAVPGAIAAYTALVTETARFDPLFVQALARKLASHLVQPLLKADRSVHKATQELYTLELARAKTADAREGRPYASPEGEWNGGHDNPWITARMGAYARRL